MRVTVETRGVERGFKRAGADPQVKRLAAAVFRYPLTRGLAQYFGAAQSHWPPNSPEWAQRKGTGKRVWENSGRTLRALSNNPPSPKLGTRRGLRTGVNPRSLSAFAYPTTFRDSKGKRLDQKRQAEVYQALRAGSGKGRLKAFAKKKARSFEDVLKEVGGLKKRAPDIPGRPWVFWQTSWIDDVVRDLEETATAIIIAEGFDASL